MLEKIERLKYLQSQIFLSAARFDESQVNRDKSGKFAPKSGSEGGEKTRLQKGVDRVKSKVREGVDYAKEHPGRTAAGIAGAVGVAALGVKGRSMMKNRKPNLPPLTDEMIQKATTSKSSGLHSVRPYMERMKEITNQVEEINKKIAINKEKLSKSTGGKRKAQVSQNIKDLTRERAVLMKEAASIHADLDIKE